MQKATIKEVSWQDALPAISRKCPELGRIIEQWSPSSEYTLFHIRYPFAAVILDEGVFYIPNEAGKMVSIQDPSISEYVRDSLTYAAVPVGVITDKYLEVFHEDENQVAPLRLLDGVGIGTLELFDSAVSFRAKQVWTVTSGARSNYMFPKIAEANAHERLKRKYKFFLSQPKGRLEQHAIFSAVANSDAFDKPWHSDVYFFSKKWLETQNDNNGWLQFYTHLFKTAWEHTEFARNQGAYSIIWKLFSDHLFDMGIKADAYLIDVVKHIVLVATGALTGLSPVSPKEDDFGPFARLQAVYVKDYGLRYVPTIFTARHFNLNEDRAVYYPLQASMLLSSAPRGRHAVSIMRELRALRELLDAFLNLAKEGQLKIEDTPIEEVIHKIKIEYFHSEVDEINHIQATSDMPKGDPYLLKHAGGGKLPFASGGSLFAKGTVRISRADI